MKIKQILLLLLSSFAVDLVFSQEKEIVVTGTVLDHASGAPLEFASVELFLTADSTLIQTTITDKHGKFTLNKIQPGTYIIRTGSVGYESNSTEITVSRSRESLPAFRIRASPKELKEVTVTSAKPQLSTGLDRRIYNVSTDIMAQTGSASDILRNIPSVEVDIDGQVSLRGSSNPMILINGKPSLLMGNSQADVLEQLPANYIERIEVITNPSAKYRPDGTTGIINIILKKNAKLGWNGALNLAAGNNHRYNTGINLNYKPGKLNVFTNYNHREDRRERRGEVSRTYFDPSGMPRNFYRENNNSIFRRTSDFFSSGIEYTFSERNSVGISGNYYFRNGDRDDISDRLFYDNNQAQTGLVRRFQSNPESEKEKEATVFWQHNFPEEDHELRIQGNFAAEQEKEFNYNSNEFLFPLGPVTLDNVIVIQDEKQQEITVDYARPFGEDKKWEAGYEGIFNQIDMDYLVENYNNAQGKFLTDLSKTNRFLYKEAIHAFYSTYQQEFEKFGFIAGLRIEQANMDGHLLTKDSMINNQYFKIYPSIHLLYKLDKNELRLSYSKRVNRADADELNPFAEYSDPYNLEAGNPALLPEIIHAYELGYKLQKNKFSFVPSLYYRYTKKGFTEVTLPLNDTVLLTTTQNLASSSSAGLEMIISAKPFPFMTVNLSSNLFYNQIDAESLGLVNKKSIVSMSGNLNSTFILSKTTFWQISSNWRSARLTPQGKSLGSFVMNSGVRQDLFNKKLTATFTVSDIFKTWRQETTINSTSLSQISRGWRDSRIFYLGISYRFGGNPKKPSEEKMEFDDGL